MRDEKLSANFKRSEFACKGVGCCGGAAPVDLRLVALLQKIRDAVEKPITVTNGFRCITHNANPKVGGVPDSYHTTGTAADIFCPGMHVSQIYFVVVASIRDMGYGWCKVYPEKGIVHVDIHSR